ncbi:hypothetical protein C1891_08175 [Pseudomonas sp. GW456-12-1-14-TSB6]|nr:hypothetical protein C1891_08175 [Pseudomonas sp. GW456-12-1-14-TSB6]
MVALPRTLCVRFWDAERPWLHSHAERGNDQQKAPKAKVYGKLRAYKRRPRGFEPSQLRARSE